MTEIENLPNIPLAEKEEVLTLSVEATAFLNSFAWCTKIKKGYLSKQWGYRLCVFYFEIEAVDKTPDCIWVIAGDLPPVHVSIQQASSPTQALERYVALMEDWIEHVKTGKPVAKCYPVQVDPIEKYADMLMQRTEKIKNYFIPELRNS